MSGATGIVTKAAVWRNAAGLAIAALLLRLFRLGDWSLWIDEGNTLWLTEFLSGKRATDSYPVFFWLEKAMIELFGTSEFALRLLPAVLGAASIPLPYLLFRRVAGERAAFWAALLMCLSPWHIFWSQNARYYTLLLLEAMLLFKLAWSWWLYAFILLFVGVNDLMLLLQGGTFPITIAPLVLGSIGLSLSAGSIFSRGREHSP